MAWRKAAFCGALLVCVVAATGLARAQAPSRSDQARQKFERGVVLLGQNKWNEAIAELEAARALYPTAPVHFNLGLAYRAIGRGKDAIASFERYRRAVGDGMEATRQAELNRYLTTLRAGLVQLQVDVTPADATVLLDKEAFRPGMIELDAGKHALEITAPGYDPQSKELELTPGSTTRVSIVLIKTQLRAQLTVATTQAIANIKIDGQSRGEGKAIVQLEAGRHTVEVTAEGFVPLTREVTLVAGAEESLSVTLKKKRKPGPYVALGIIVAAVVGGAVAAGVILGSKDQAPLSPQLGVVHTGIEVARW